LLRHPCKCTGSIKFVHQDCLQLWISSNEAASARGKCEVCGETLRWARHYKRGAPTTILNVSVLVSGANKAAKRLLVFTSLLVETVFYAAAPTLLAMLAIWLGTKTLHLDGFDLAWLRRNWPELAVAGWIVQRYLLFCLCTTGVHIPGKKYVPLVISGSRSAICYTGHSSLRTHTTPTAERLLPPNLLAPILPAQQLRQLMEARWVSNQRPQRPLPRRKRRSP
jgi:hypothetical protein